MPMSAEARSRSSVLIVDDVPESRESLSAMLEEEGYEVRAVFGAEAALKAAAAKPPGVILFRILDPPQGAIDFVRRLALDDAMRVPVVVVTALNEFQLGSFLNGVPGVRRVVYVPCGPEDLLAAVAQAAQYSVGRA